jgi:hypothetical protein
LLHQRVCALAWFPGLNAKSNTLKAAKKATFALSAIQLLMKPSLMRFTERPKLA